MRFIPDGIQPIVDLNTKRFLAIPTRPFYHSSMLRLEIHFSREKNETEAKL